MLRDHSLRLVAARRVWRKGEGSRGKGAEEDDGVNITVMRAM